MKNFARVALISSFIACSLASAASAVDFKLREMNDICILNGSTAEEITLLKLIDNSIDKAQSQLVKVFVPCSTIDRMKKGETELFYPLFVVTVAKTDGKLVPFTSMTIGKLKKQIEVMFKTHDFAEDAAKAVSVVEKTAKENYSDAKFNMEAGQRSIVDETDKTISVASKTTVSINGTPSEITEVATSIITDGYVITVQAGDKVSSAKEFWRLQFFSEWAARQVVVVP